MEELNSKTASFKMLEKDIMMISMKEGAIIDVPEMEENIRVSKKLTFNNRYGVLVDGRTFASITKEAREFIDTPTQFAHVIAEAMIVNSLATRLMANFLAQFRKKNKIVEMKVFNDYSTALAWLKKKVEEDGKLNKHEKRKSKEVSFLSTV